MIGINVKTIVCSQICNTPNNSLKFNYMVGNYNFTQEKVFDQ